MDFLMPGYLGSHEVFRRKYELPISKNGPEGQDAQLKLKRKLHPFLLRRLKKTVARELPAKIEKVAHCELTGDQKAVYTAILQAARRNITNLVASKGFNKARMEVLTTLLKLRQACCHLELVGMQDLEAKQPSAKLDLFMELVDEAVDGGHRILVFSQFVSMLKILRRELEARGYTYCYLDGSTKNRMEVVHEFNSNRTIPLFLISLKAGGTGLNLTGADMVIHFDPWWNPAVEAQATDRAYRIGQKNTVYSMKLITLGTVEEKVIALQQRKRDVINATVETDEEVISSLTWEDMQELLGI
jgi:SNF2 family DNA or RNA helicase